MIDVQQNKKIADRKFQKYLEVYYTKISNEDIRNKKYSVTIYRGLIMYYLHQEHTRRNFKITLQEIAKRFGLNSHSTVVYSIQKTRDYLNNIKLLKNEYRIKFIYLNYIYNQILNQQNKWN